MEDTTRDTRVLARIQRLVAEEHALRNKAALDAAEKERLSAMEVDLDQCWDLLRQRRALREFGEDPEKAEVRPARIVENYEQ